MKQNLFRSLDKIHKLLYGAQTTLKSVAPPAEEPFFQEEDIPNEELAPRLPTTQEGAKPLTSIDSGSLREDELFENDSELIPLVDQSNESGNVGVPATGSSSPQQINMVPNASSPAITQNPNLIELMPRTFNQEEQSSGGLIMLDPNSLPKTPDEESLALAAKGKGKGKGEESTTSDVDYFSDEHITPESPEAKATKKAAFKVLDAHRDPATGEIDPKAFSEIRNLPEFSSSYLSMHFVPDSPDKNVRLSLLRHISSSYSVGLGTFYGTAQKQAPDFIKAVTPDPNSLSYYILKSLPLMGGINFGVYTDTNHRRSQTPATREEAELRAVVTATAGGAFSGMGSNRMGVLSIHPVMNEDLITSSQPIADLGTFSTARALTTVNYGASTTEEYMRNIFLHEYAHAIHAEIEWAAASGGLFNGRRASQEEDQELSEIQKEILATYRANRDKTLDEFAGHTGFPDDIKARINKAATRWKQQSEIDVDVVFSFADSMAQFLRENGRGKVKLQGVLSMYSLTSAREWFAESFGTYMRNPKYFAKRFPELTPLMERVSKVHIRRLQQADPGIAKIALEKFGIQV